MINLRNVTKRFGERKALDGVSFEVKDGEVLGFLGPNGAGKTTTMRIITGFLKPSGGSVTVNGLSVLDHSVSVRKMLGYLPESALLYQDMLAGEYLDFIADVRGLRGERKLSRLEETVEVCGIGSVLGQPIGELSKGYKQRVGLAQALVHDPPILILDEPTSGLDPNQIVEIRSLIKSIGRSKTVILSTHILPEVSATCDRVVIINRGRIAASGTTEELQRRATGREQLYAKVKGPKEEAGRSLGAIEGAVKVEQVDQEDGRVFGFRLEVEAGRDLREQVFRTVADRGWALLELRRDQVSLEEVFRELTLSD